MLRDIKINKAQFIAIFLMAFLGIFAYTGIYAEYYGLVQTSDQFYADTNMADAWIYNTDFDDVSLDKVNEFTTLSDRQEVVQSHANLEGKPDITLHFVEKGTISKFYTTEGEDFDPNDDGGVWLDTRFADARNLKVGDKISFEFDNQTIKKQIKGLGYSPEYIYEVSPYSLTPDFHEMGFAYMSAKAYPQDQILLVCDGAMWHKANSLVIPAQITLIFIPPYTPEMNPIEQIWKEIRKRGFRNEVFKTLEKVIDRLCDVINNLPASVIQSITGRQWILSMF